MIYTRGIFLGFELEPEHAERLQRIQEWRSRWGWGDTPREAWRELAKVLPSSDSRFDTEYLAAAERCREYRERQAEQSDN